MDPIVLSLVLAAALLHATWNALVKSGGDPFVRLAVVNTVGGLCTLPLLFLAAPPAPASWPYLIGSVLVHYAYSWRSRTAIASATSRTSTRSRAASRRLWSHRRVGFAGEGLGARAARDPGHLRRYRQPRIHQ